MKRLDEQSFRKAKEYLFIHGRRLEQALFNYHFENGSEDDVLDALREFQNEDGGFGNRIEPDFQLDQSSPMATTLAFQIFKELNLSSDHPMVRDGMTYLLKTYHSEKGRWHALPPEVNNVPHAPWWHYDNEKERVMVEASWGNPNAEISGYLLRYKELVPEEVATNLKGRCLAHFKALDTLDMHETFCFLRLAGELSQIERDPIIEKVKEHIPELVNLKREQWANYGMQPVQLVKGVQSPFYEMMKESVEENLDYVIEKQHSDGSWHPNWEWGQYENDWPESKELWKGILTYEKLKLLKSHGRLETQTVKSQ
ncbi:prenyltransferase/squalene oxidase repeat-containing protein [Alkalihalobacillus sp. AL-G]|uniref:prenyltransferase/squalene oxidase repeat-containing protein n=1 Tax=Alkalihalobacillus sp. AL-G TaxID=2926399 RepID=UPI00272CF185|nr:prenyltransferase/squalene oxidase repeat-containing protein [Alkalihalobacillus sp. AL-G]WLD94278.1 hypothetical protein MOJ78_05125 [Alkalihalobacillus sp. AL-G]